MGFFHRKKKIERKEYDRETQKPILHCSICNGEQVAGFKNLQTGEFTEVMYIRTEEDLQQFFAMYGLTEVTKEY